MAIYESGSFYLIVAVGVCAFEAIAITINRNNLPAIFCSNSEFPPDTADMGIYCAGIDVSIETLHLIQKLNPGKQLAMVSE